MILSFDESRRRAMERHERMHSHKSCEDLLGYPDCMGAAARGTENCTCKTGWFRKPLRRLYPSNDGELEVHVRRGIAERGVSIGGRIIEWDSIEDLVEWLHWAKTWHDTSEFQKASQEPKR